MLWGEGSYLSEKNRIRRKRGEGGGAEREREREREREEGRGEEVVIKLDILFYKLS